MSNLKPSAPKTQTVLISIILVFLGLFGATLSPEIAENGDWILLIGYLILLAGVYIKNI